MGWQWDSAKPVFFVFLVLFVLPGGWFFVFVLLLFCLGGLKKGDFPKSNTARRANSGEARYSHTPVTNLP